MKRWNLIPLHRACFASPSGRFSNYSSDFYRQKLGPGGLQITFFQRTPNSEPNSRKNFLRENSNEPKCIVQGTTVPGSPGPPVPSLQDPPVPRSPGPKSPGPQTRLHLKFWRLMADSHLSLVLKNVTSLKTGFEGKGGTSANTILYLLAVRGDQQILCW